MGRAPIWFPATLLLATGLTCLFSSAPATLRAQSRRSLPPRVLVETFRCTDTLGRHAAVALRAALSQRVAPGRIAVIPTSVIEESRNVGLPDDFGNALGWNDVRLVARLHRADVVVDLCASASPRWVELRASRVRPAATGTPIPLPVVRARTLSAAVDLLARRLATDTVLLERVGSQPALPR